MLINKYIIERKVFITIVLILIVTLLCLKNLAFYLIPNTTLIVLLAISPFIFTIDKNEQKLRYAWISIVFITLYFFLKMQLFFFLSFSTFILFIIESNIGRVNLLPLFIIVLISPYSTFIFNVFGFPARLIITDIAAYILSFVMENVETNGNIILINKQRFSVDPECMGLIMIGYGYATTLLFINSFEKRYQRKLNFIKVIEILCISTFFIIVVNLFRIVMIVILQSKPETILHELVGLISFGIYFILPMYFIIKFIIKKDKTQFKKSFGIISTNKLVVAILSFSIILILSYFNFNREHYRNIEVDNKTCNIELTGYTKTITPEHVLTFNNNEALIYIKPSCHFLGPDHSPTICWKGSGYEFENIKVEKIGLFEIYTADLKKENETLKTAWWFDNGNIKTISQLEWRWKTARGEEPFRLINVTTSSKDELNNQINQLIKKNLFIND